MRILSPTVLMLIISSCALLGLPVHAQAQASVYSDGYESAAILPPVVVEAAKAAKPGIILKKAKLTWRTDEGVYIVVGRLYSGQWRMNITSSGDVLSVVELDDK